MSEPWLSEILGHGLYYFEQIRPLIPTYALLIISAVFPIYTGSHASLHRPISAAKPPKSKTRDDSRIDVKVEEDTTSMQGFELSDVLLYPLLAGGMLTGLYYLIKYLEDPAILSTILNGYLSVFGLFGLSTFLADGFETVWSCVFPDKYYHNGRVWIADESRRLILPQKTHSLDMHPGTRLSPLPSFLSHLPIPEQVLWWIRNLARRPALILTLKSSRATINLRLIPLKLVSIQLAILLVGYFNLISRPWWITNLLGFSFTYSAFQLMSPTTFFIGTMLLAGLFFYDIYMVFFTPMMITVASKLDIPAKLVFPKPGGGDSDKSQYAMLGLGDIVIPGIVIAFALRFDLFMFYLKKQTAIAAATSGASITASTASTASPSDPQPSTPLSQTVPRFQKATYTRVTGTWGDRFWLGQHASRIVGGSFAKPYFTAGMVGYVIGLLITLGVMHVFNHGQPALLYLVPCVLGAIWATGLCRGELRVMWRYTEDTEEARKSGLDSAAILRREAPGALGAEAADAGKGDGQEEGEGESREESENAKKTEIEIEIGSGQGNGTIAAVEESKPSKPTTSETQTDKPARGGDRHVFSLSISLPPPVVARSVATTGGPADAAKADAQRFEESFVEVGNSSVLGAGEPAGKRRKLA